MRVFEYEKDNTTFYAKVETKSVKCYGKQESEFIVLATDPEVITLKDGRTLNVINVLKPIGLDESGYMDYDTIRSSHLYYVKGEVYAYDLFTNISQEEYEALQKA